MNINYQSENTFTSLQTQNFAQGGATFTAHSGSNFKEAMGQLLNKEQGAKSEIDTLLEDMDFAQRFSYEGTKMDDKDIAFFLGLIDENRLAGACAANYTANIEGQLRAMNVEEVVKSSNVSKTLIELISKTNSTNKPVRVDFDNDITLVLRVDREGKLSAQFFPGDKAAEEYLKNNLPYLKNRFDEQEIPYAELSYKQRHSQQKDKKEKEDTKENKNE